MSRLCEIALKYGTDKCPEWKGGTGHSYTPFYDELFRGWVPNRVMELGINQGASLFLWAEYWPEAEVVGADNHQGALNDVSQRINERITLLYADCGNFLSLKLLRDECKFRFGSFDLILDDASHEPEHQILAANILFPLIRPGGYYIIEDVRTAEIAERIQSELLYPSEIVSLNTAAKEDDRLIIMRKK